MNYGVIMYILLGVVMLGNSMYDDITSTESSEFEGNSYTPHIGSTYYVGADGSYIVLFNNDSAVDPTYEQLMSFIDDDCTDDIKYNESSFTCGDYAEVVHNNAEKAGIKAAWVAVDLMGNEDHACNAFNTTDKGIVFIDCTESDKIVTVWDGCEYKPERSGVEYEPMGLINGHDIFW